MIKAVHKTSVKKEPLPGDDGSYYEDYFNRLRTLERGPQAFLATWAARRVSKPHFHRVDQFQVVVHGTCKLGPYELAPVSLQYADSFTPYGPIVVHDEPMSFFNLRSGADPGAQYMPESREKIERKGGRQVAAQGRLTWADRTPNAQMETLIAPHDDGLAAYEILAGPGARLPDEVVGGAWRYQIVVAGDLLMNGESLPADSLVLASGGDQLFGRRAGPDGVHLVEVQLPTG